MDYVFICMSGMLITNAVPHLVAGLQGRPFPTPFARPSGFGNSPAIVNFLWGALNLLVGLYLYSMYPVKVGVTPGFGVFLLGILVIGIFCAWHFGKVQRDKGIT